MPAPTLTYIAICRRECTKLFSLDVIHEDLVK